MISALNPFTYFRRNLGKTLPMAFVIVLSVDACRQRNDHHPQH